MNPQGCQNLPPTAFVPASGTWFRAIQPQYWPTALQTSQTARIPSRFSAGHGSFEVLYLAENAMVALFEVQALLGSPSQPGSVISQPRQAWSIINVDVQLTRVVNLADPACQSVVETTAQELTGDWRGYKLRSNQTPVAKPTGDAPTQELGEALFAVRDAEGFYAISAKLPYHRILVVFPEKLQSPNHVTFHHPQTGATHTIP